jgi:hypothetical protein
MSQSADRRTSVPRTPSNSQSSESNTPHAPSEALLAPTRRLVDDLNLQARDHLLANRPAGREVRLADGNQASVGDVIITLINDRRLR